MVTLLFSLRNCFRARAVLLAEIHALRHQLLILQRSSRGHKLLHGIAYNLVNLFRLLQLPQPWRSTQIETLRARLFKIGARIRQTAASASIWLLAGRGNLCSAMSPWL
jgi:Transposase DDE domain group 1